MEYYSGIKRSADACYNVHKPGKHAKWKIMLNKWKHAK